jgi:hypothetical protein|tara:strand:+ start:8521 stop:8952 length:432 start_codon:yes stop_codon:yes gene_type:complete
MTMYAKMAPIELAREQSDLLYHLFINTQTKTLDDVCGQIATTLKERYGEEHISIRLQNMLTRTQQDSDRIAKHGLLLFALFQEPDVRSIFMGTGPDNPPRVPPEKFQYFVDTELPACVDKLLTGALTSLRAFVEDARWGYCIL